MFSKTAVNSIYVVIKKECKNKDDAMVVVNADKTWSYHFKNVGSDGNKIYYRCSKAKKRAKQCPAGLYLLLHNDSEKVSIFRTVETHDHEQLEPSNRIPINTKNEIKQLFDLKIKPKRIWELLRERDIVLKNKQQLTSVIKQFRKKQNGSSSISLGEFEAFCEEHVEVPDDDDVGYVVAFEVKYPDDDNDDDDDDDDDERKFRTFFSTKRLITQAFDSKVLHCDATYKLVWEGMPVLIIGTTDSDRHFHPFGMAICSNEKTDDFVFVYDSLRREVQALGGSIDPEVLVSDASEAIRNGFVQVFGREKLLVMCWAHVRKNIDKHLHLLNDQKHRDDVLDVKTYFQQIYVLTL